MKDPIMLGVALENLALADPATYRSDQAYMAERMAAQGAGSAAGMESLVTAPLYLPEFISGVAGWTLYAIVQPGQALEQVGDSISGAWDDFWFKGYDDTLRIMQGDIYGVEFDRAAFGTEFGIGLGLGAAASRPIAWGRGLDGDIAPNTGNAVELAGNWQTKFPYVGQDPMRPIALGEGRVLAQVVFEPGHGPAGNYFTTPSAIRRATQPDGSIDANILNQGLQIDASRYPSFRPTVQYFRVNKAIPFGEAAFGRAIANPHLNPDGYPVLPQVFIKDDFLSRMAPVDTLRRPGVSGQTMVNTTPPAYQFDWIPPRR
jgi:hypothetical protein